MNPAFAYIYDEYLSDPKHERVLAQLENELGHRGIEGRIARLAMFRSAKDMIGDLVRVGISNLVFVGNDQTLLKMMSFLPEIEVTVGFVPMTSFSVLARRLCIPLGIESVDILAARLVERIDVGICNDRYFLFDVVVSLASLAMEMEKKYHIHVQENAAIAIQNLGSLVEKEANKKSSHVQDGKLDLVIKTPQPRASSFWLWRRKMTSETRIPFQDAVMRAQKKIELLLDGQKIEGNKFSFSILPQRLRMITGGYRIR